MQKIIFTADFSISQALDLARDLSLSGYTVSATQEGSRWTITGMRAKSQIDPDLEKEADRVACAAGLKR